MRAQRPWPRRKRHGQRERRATLSAQERAERIVALVGEETINAAFAESHLIGELPASIWRQLISTMQRLGELPWSERKRRVARESEIMRRLFALLVLDHDATIQAMRAKLER